MMEGVADEKSLRRKKRDYKLLATVGKSSDNASDGDVDEAAVENSAEESPNDEQIQVMEKELMDARKEEDRLKRKEKFKRLSMEREEVNRSIRNIQKSEKKKKVNAESLRGMQDVKDKVDKMMNNKLNFESFSSTSSSSSSNDSDSSSSKDSSSSEDDKVSKKKKKSRSSKKKDKKDKKHKKSGKNRKLTSHVKYPQDWPHSFLSLQFISKDKKYDDLTMAEFCAGYCSILEKIKGKDKQLLTHRITHFKDLMYLTATYQWKSILNYHSSVLLEIERGNISWGSDFQKIQSIALAAGCLPARGGSSSFRSNTITQRQSLVSDNAGPILFCKSYQRGFCPQANDHNGPDKFGEIRNLRHICANCWLKDRKQLKHPESDQTCPSKQEL